MPIVCWRLAKEESSPTEKVPSLRPHLASCRALLNQFGCGKCIATRHQSFGAVLAPHGRPCGADDDAHHLTTSISFTSPIAFLASVSSEEEWWGVRHKRQGRN